MIPVKFVNNIRVLMVAHCAEWVELSAEIVLIDHEVAEFLIGSP